MFIDIHTHARIGKVPLWNDEYFLSGEELLQKCDKFDIDKAVLLPMVSPDFYLPQSVDEILMICGTHPDRFIPFCNIDPPSNGNRFDAPMGDLLKYYKDKGCRGIGEVTANMSFLDPLMQNLFKGAEEARMPLLFHIAPELTGNYGIYDLPGLPQLEISLQRFPNLIFLGHSQAFWAEMTPLVNIDSRYGYPTGEIKEEGRVPQLMRKYGNLYCDLSAGSGYSAMNRDRSYAAKFMTEFQDRILFGTDICHINGDAPLAGLLKEMLEKGEISQTVFQKIARENAQKLCNI